MTSGTTTRRAGCLMALGLMLVACGAPTSSGADRSARTVTETVTVAVAALATPDDAREPDDAGEPDGTGGSEVSRRVGTDTPDVAAPLPGGTVPASPIDRFRCGPATVRVGDAAQLTAALAAATAGQVIHLDPGTYAGAFVAKASGTADRPIYLCGDRGAVIDGGSVKGGYGLHLDGAAHWRVSGFTVRNAQKGVMVDHGTDIGLQDLLVEQIGDEAVHLRSFSTGNVVRGLTIRQTGLRRDKFGEGVYVGSAQSNWGKLTDGRPDASNGNFVLENTITQTTSEAVDVKEGTVGGVVAGNRFDGSALTGADSWVDVKGNGWLVADNTGRSTPKDGFQTHVVVQGWGDRNLFMRNTAELGPGTGVAFYLHEPGGNRVSCGNRAVGGTLTNATCSG